MAVVGINDLGQAECAVKCLRPRRHRQRRLVEPHAGAEIEPHLLMPHRPMPAAEARRIVDREPYELASKLDCPIQRHPHPKQCRYRGCQRAARSVCRRCLDNLVVPADF